MIDFLNTLAHLTHYPDNRFFVLVGLDPLGCFNRVSGISYEMPAFEFKELGRNHSAVMLPFDGPGQPGELVLKSGMVARQMLYDWMNDVTVGGDFYKNVLVVHLTQNWVPLKIFFLTGCWPKRWEGSELQAEGSAEMATEQLTLVFDQISQVPYLGLAAIAGQLAASALGGAEAESVDEERRGTQEVRAKREIGEGKGLDRYTWQYIRRSRHLKNKVEFDEAKGLERFFFERGWHDLGPSRYEFGEGEPDDAVVDASDEALSSAIAGGDASSGTTGGGGGGSQGGGGGSQGGGSGGSGGGGASGGGGGKSGGGKSGGGGGSGGGGDSVDRRGGDSP